MKAGSHDVAGTGQPLRKVQFQLDWYPAAEHGGHFQAVAKNYYRDAGLDVMIVSGGPGASGMQKVAMGQLEFAMGRADDVILAVERGLPLLIVGAQMQHDPQSIMVHDESPVKSFRDLDGKSIMASPGSNWIAFLQARYGISFGVFPIDFGMARFMADKNFIQQCFISNEPYFVGLHGVKARALLIADAGYDPYRVIFTSRTFARDHPEAVRAFMAGSIRGWIDFLHGDATEARARIEHENPSQSQPLIDYSIATMKSHKLVEGDPAKGERMGLITRARLTDLVGLLVELKVLDAPVPLEKFASFDFLPAELAVEKK
jgi:NitT/TauT family transport system substrate-binding protein